MPLYEYQCAKDGRFELIRKFSDPPAHDVPHLRAAEVQKLLSAPAIQFKGTGWYVTDYAARRRADRRFVARSPKVGQGSPPRTPAASEGDVGARKSESVARRTPSRPAPAPPLDRLSARTTSPGLRRERRCARAAVASAHEADAQCRLCLELQRLQVLAERARPGPSRFSANSTVAFRKPSLLPASWRTPSNR